MTLQKTKSNVPYIGSILSVGLLMTGLIVPALTTAVITGYYVHNNGQQDYTNILGKIVESLRELTLDTNKSTSIDVGELEYYKCQINYIRGKFEYLRRVKEI